MVESHAPLTPLLTPSTTRHDSTCTARTRLGRRRVWLPGGDGRRLCHDPRHDWRPEILAAPGPRYGFSFTSMCMRVSCLVVAQYHCHHGDQPHRLPSPPKPGTSLAAVVATGSGGAISYATAAGMVDWEVRTSSTHWIHRSIASLRTDRVRPSVRRHSIDACPPTRSDQLFFCPIALDAMAHHGMAGGRLRGGLRDALRAGRGLVHGAPLRHHAQAPLRTCVSA